MAVARRARIVRVPFGLGANKYAGLELGPEAVEILARRHLRGFQLDALPESTSAPFRFPLEPGSIEIAAPRLLDESFGGSASVRHLSAVEDVGRRVSESLNQMLDEQPAPLPIVLGGDHSISIGSLASLTRSHRDVGVIWIDSHADYNTGFSDEEVGTPEYASWNAAGSKDRRGTTTSGNIHGMPLAAATGRGDPLLTGLFGNRFLDPRNIVLIGVRDFDREEREWAARDGLHCLSARAVAFWGIPAVAKSAVRHLLRQGVRRVHVSLDIDVIDGSFVPGTGTRVPGGLVFREADLLLKLLRDWLSDAEIEIHAFDLVELNPLIDRDCRAGRLAARLLCAFLGEEIVIGETFDIASAPDIAAGRQAAAAIPSP